MPTSCAAREQRAAVECRLEGGDEIGARQAVFCRSRGLVDGEEAAERIDGGLPHQFEPIEIEKAGRAVSDRHNGAGCVGVGDERIGGMGERDGDAARQGLLECFHHRVVAGNLGKQGQRDAGILDQRLGQAGVAAGFRHEHEIGGREAEPAAILGHERALQAHFDDPLPAGLVARFARLHQPAQVGRLAQIVEQRAHGLRRHLLFVGEAEIHRLNPAAGRACARR